MRRNLRYPLFEAFDRPDTNASCPRRNRSTIAPQALVLMNSEFSLATARDLAGLLMETAGANAAAQVDLCYRRTLARAPAEAEKRTALEFLAAETLRLTEQRRPVGELALPNPLPPDVDPYAAAALTDLCLAIFNLNEFIYVD